MRRIYPQLNIRRSVAFILATLLLAALSVPFLSIPVSAAESGTCGDGLSWSLSAGTLTISGTGPMYNYAYSFESASGATNPWANYTKQIKKAIYYCKNSENIKKFLICSLLF